MTPPTKRDIEQTVRELDTVERQPELETEFVDIGELDEDVQDADPDHDLTINSDYIVTSDR